jgi:hypothetical protein
MFERLPMSSTSNRRTRVGSQPACAGMPRTDGGVDSGLHQNARRTGDTRWRRCFFEGKLNECAVSDRTSLEGLPRFSQRTLWARLQTTEYKRHGRTAGFEGGFCPTLFRTVRNSLILKRRDVGVVDRARLESDFGEHH